MFSLCPRPQFCIASIKLAIVNTIVPLAFPSIGLDQSEVMNELREIKLLCFSFSRENYPKSSPDLDSPIRLQFHSPFPIPC